MRELLLASRSEGKIREIRRILAPLDGLRIVGLAEAGIEYRAEEEDLEPFETFEANALSKARYFHALSGLPTVADDSGLEVDALGGAPGVRTKRFAPDQGLDGEALDAANNRHLIEKLEGVEEGARGAKYVCVAALVTPLEVATFRGEAPGRVVAEPRGDGGFGYDPHILNPSLGRTFAEMSWDEKDARSHRGAAFRALLEHLARGAAAGDA